MSKQNTQIPIVVFIPVVVFLLIGAGLSPVSLAQESLELVSPASKTQFASDDPKLKPMFTKDSFEGWVQLGGKSKYEIKDGVITGTCIAGEPNSFMSTGMDYTNFEMEVEFKAHPAMNSGIQIRSHCFANPTEFKLADGKIRKIAAERVHGYQVEIDPSKTRHSGGIYDEARRRWLVNLKNNPTAREAFKPNEWNHLRIKCDGDHLQTWINGVVAVDLKDDVTASGFIALQVHGANGRKHMFNTTVQWRNIRIKLLD